MMETVTNIKTWKDLKAEFDSIGEFWVFRGHADSEWSLQTSMDRFDFKEKYKAEERMLYDLSKNYKAFNQPEVDFSDNVQKIALLQHHGAPTRFLDVTHSPYIAAYFAFENIPKEVEYCSIYAFHYLSLEMRTLQLLEENKASLDLKEIKNRPRLNDSEIFTKLVLNKNQKKFVGVVNPSHLFSRLRNQTGSFLCQGDINCDFEDNLSDIKNTIYQKPVLKKYILPKSMRLDVLTDLRKMNITRFTLFQDFDGFAKSLPFECEIQLHREENFSTEYKKNNNKLL